MGERMNPFTNEEDVDGGGRVLIHKYKYHNLLISIILFVIGLGIANPAQASGTPPSETAPKGEKPGAFDSFTSKPTQTDGDVCVVMFWMDGCPHCQEVLDTVLPPLLELYGDRLTVNLIEVKSVEDVDRLMEIGGMNSIPYDVMGIPFFIIGDQALLGSLQIPRELPGLVEKYLAADGVSCPDLPELADATTAELATGEEATMASDEDVASPALPVVQLILFWTPDCHACQFVKSETLPPIQEKYGEQLRVQYIDVITSEDVERLYRVAASFGLTEEQVNLPMLIIGEHVLIGSEEIPARLDALVETYLTAGGFELPDIARLWAGVSPTDQAIDDRPNGFGLAIAVLAGMIAGLVYAMFVIYRAYNGMSTPAQPGWLGYAFPILCLIGLGVAGYLTYVETQSVSAVCGPVGECNTVQSSQFAWVLDVMPVGVLGLLGYLGILAAWLWSRSREDRLAKIAPLAIFGMTLFGVLFSIYLTYLEPFVIRAVCLWCLSSSIIITLLFLLGLNALTQAVNIKDD